MKACWQLRQPDELVRAVHCSYTKAWLEHKLVSCIAQQASAFRQGVLDVVRHPEGERGHHTRMTREGVASKGRRAGTDITREGLRGRAPQGGIAREGVPL